MARNKLCLVFGPCLLAAFAFEHAYRAPIVGIEHRPNYGGFLVALAASSDRGGIVAGKYFVPEIVSHRKPAR
jgi:hypothetical protein